MATPLFVTAEDPELPALLKPGSSRAVFATQKQLRTVLGVKPGPMVILLDETQSELVGGLSRTDVRAVAIVTPRKVPVIFHWPVIAVVERPLCQERLLHTLERALTELQA